MQTPFLLKNSVEAYCHAAIYKVILNIIDFRRDFIVRYERRGKTPGDFCGHVQCVFEGRW